MARLCSPGNLDEEVFRGPDGRFKLSSFITKTHLLALELHASLTNSSSFVLKKSFKKCVDLLNENKTDYIVSFASNSEDEPYYIPVQFDSTSVYFLTGFNVGNYEKKN